MPTKPFHPAAPAVRVTPEPGRPAAEELALARRVLMAEAAAVEGVAGLLGEEFVRAVDLVARCADQGGTVLVTGLGKSGLIGAKISATLASLAIPSHFVHPAEAAHGDLGRFRPTDLCLALSYSGETDEVVNLAAILRQDGVPVVSITRGRPEEAGGAPGQMSSLERLATARLSIGRCDDPDLTPAPTCSTVASMALGDALALCAARRRNFTDDDFAKRHPGGSLGGLLRPVNEILRFTVGKNLEPVCEGLSVREAIAAAERTNVRRPGALLVVDARGVLAGVFTDADLRRLVAKDQGALAAPIRELMTRSPHTLLDTSLVRDAVRMVREFRHDEIPVVDAAGKPVGILDVQDLVAMRLIRSE